jgi:hypothetical protein
MLRRFGSLPALLQHHRAVLLIAAQVIRAEQSLIDGLPALKQQVMLIMSANVRRNPLRELLTPPHLVEVRPPPGSVAPLCKDQLDY